MPDRDLTDEEYAILSAPPMVEWMSKRALRLEGQGVPRDQATGLAMLEAELEVCKRLSSKHQLLGELELEARQKVATLAAKQRGRLGATIGDRVKARGQGRR